MADDPKSESPSKPTDGAAAIILERVAAGDLSVERVRLAAYLGHEGAQNTDLGRWAPPRDDDEVGGLRPVAQVLAHADLDPALLRRATGEVLAEHLPVFESCRRSGAPRACVHAALNPDAPVDPDLLSHAVAVAQDTEFSANLSRNLGQVATDERQAALEPAANATNRAVQVALASVATARVVAGERPTWSAQVALDCAVLAAEDPDAERARQRAILGRLILGAGGPPPHVAPPSDEQREHDDVRQLLESAGGSEDPTTGSAPDPAAAVAATPAPIETPWTSWLALGLGITGGVSSLIFPPSKAILVSPALLLLSALYFFQVRIAHWIGAVIVAAVLVQFVPYTANDPTLLNLVGCALGFATIAWFLWDGDPTC